MGRKTKLGKYLDRDIGTPNVDEALRSLDRLGLSPRVSPIVAKKLSTPTVQVTPGNDGALPSADSENGPTPAHNPAPTRSTPDTEFFRNLGARAPDNRQYQNDIIDTVIRLFKDEGQRRLTIQLATGGGKTRIATQLISMMRCDLVFIVVPRKEIYGQMLAKLRAHGIEPAQVCQGHQVTSLVGVRVVLAMSQTLTRRLTFPVFATAKPDVVFIDEIHMLIGQHRAALRRWGCPVIGMTATPARLDGQTLADITPLIVQGPAVSYLQKRGYLVPEIVYTAPSPEIQHVRVKRGDYEQKELEKAYFEQGLHLTVSEHWKKYAMANGRRRRTITFAPTVNLSRNFVAEYRAAGIRAVHLDSNTHKDEREAALEDLRAHRLDVISNVGLFVEGLDLVEIECVTMCQPTRSVARYLQQVGRGLRPSPHTGKKDLVIIDHAGNTHYHGPVSRPRDWQKGGFCDNPDLRTCRYCGRVTRASIEECLGCGWVEKKARQSHTAAATMRRDLSRSTPRRVCPPWARPVQQLWYALERERQEKGLPLPDPERRVSGYVESKCVRALKEKLHG